MNIIGIDPGLSGGLAVIRSGDGYLQNLLPMPVTELENGKRQIDEAHLKRFFECVLIAPTRVYLEKVSAMPGQGVTSMFSFGLGWGLVRGILSGLGCSYVLVTPQAWQKKVLAGQPKGSEYQVASHLWPQANWKQTERCKNPHSGMIDAALIARYGYLNEGNE